MRNAAPQSGRERYVTAQSMAGKETTMGPSFTILKQHGTFTKSNSSPKVKALRYQKDNNKNYSSNKA